MKRPGHYVLGQASVMAKLVEGELAIDVPRPFGGPIPWEVDRYTGSAGQAEVGYKGERITEPARGRAWKLANLWHRGGRIVV